MGRRGEAKRGQRRPESARAHKAASPHPHRPHGRSALNRAALPSSHRGLPTYPTPLIGRGREVAAVKELLSRPDVRLVTLTGPPGVGKTRLAVETAARIAEEHPHRVVFVDLTPLPDADLVLPRILNALGIRESGGTVLAQVFRALHKRSPLLLLDNFEHVVEAAPQLAEVLASCPHVQMLVTSRVPLGLRAEHQFTVHPLLLPSVREAPTPAQVAGVPSVALFIERAQAANSDFRLTTPQEAAAVAGICTRLDGLPLAIEIVAAHAQDTPVEQIWRRLAGQWDKESLRLLAGPMTDLPSRHRTLFQAVAWSYQLLPPPCQTLLRRLSVFAGGFTLETARSICLDEDFQVDLQEAMTTLIGHHLLQHTQKDGELQYQLLQTIRGFSAAHLQGNEGTAIRRRHALHFLARAEEADPHLWGGEQISWLGRLEAELDDLREALRWSLGDSGDAEIAERLGEALSPFWDSGGHWDEGLRWLDRMLAGRTTRSPHGVRMQIAHTYLQYMRGHAVEAAESLRQARLQAQELDDAWSLAFSNIGYGVILCARGDVSRGLACLEEAIRIARERQVKGAVPYALAYVAMTYALQGNQEQAEPAADQAVVAARDEGSPRLVQFALFVRGLALLPTARGPEALAVFQECLSITVGIRERMLMARALEGVGWAAIASGAGQAGARALAGAETLRESLGAAGSDIPGWHVYHEAAVERARKLMGESAFDAAWAAGAALPAEEAIALGLSEKMEFSRDAARVRSRWGLSRRETEIVSEIAAGLTNCQIGGKFGISRRTVDFHVQNILNKLNVFSRTQIAVWAVEHGFTKMTPSSSR